MLMERLTKKSTFIKEKYSKAKDMIVYLLIFENISKVLISMFENINYSIINEYSILIKFFCKRHT